MTDHFTFAPYARPAMLTGARAPAGTDQRLLAPFKAQIIADGAAAGAEIALSSALRGPGDVLGFDASAIAASDPNDRSGLFETNYLPYVEFAEADFPWRYTLDTGGADGRLQPWLMLVALKSDEFDVLAQGDTGLAAIRVLDVAASLPAVADARLTTHVHIASAQSGAAVAAALPGGRARMLCHRRLQESTQYTLFLLPCYEQGRQAGLGGTPAATPFNAPAWVAGRSGPVDLPVYYSRRFVTNSGEDVEDLIRRLRALTAAEVAVLAAPDQIDAATPGHYPAYANPGATFSRRAATNAPGEASPGFGTDAALVALMTVSLTEVISGEAADTTRTAAGAATTANDPLVSFPAYGWRFRNETAPDVTRTDSHWFDRLNLDLPLRDAAQRGAAVVRKNQDAYMRLAWAQYEEITAANRALIALQAADRLAARLGQLRFDRLPPDVALSLSEPLLDVVPGLVRTVSLSSELRSAGVPLAYASRAMRRVAAKRMRAPKGGADPVRQSPAPSIPGDTAAKGFGAINRSFDAMRRRAPGLEPPPAQLRDDLAALLKSDILAAPIPRSGAVAVAATESDQMAQPVQAILRALPRAKANTQIGGRSPREQDSLGPVYRAPLIPDPLADQLKTMDPRALFPGLESLPENTVSFYEEDRAFVEAVMVGANHEMNAELRWRGFPTDMRGTVLRRFWQRNLPASDLRGDDIGPIHGWTRALGANPPAHDRDQAENLIMLIKGDLIRKLGQPLVEINIATGTGFIRGQGTTYEAKMQGQIGDAAYFGFDVSRDAIMAPALRDRAFVIIYEPPGRLRFGLDTATQAARVSRRDHSKLRGRFPVAVFDASRSYDRMPLPPRVPAPAIAPFGSWDDFSWSHIRLGGAGYVDFSTAPRPTNGPDYWGADKTAASLARSLWQRPIMAVLPLKRVL